MGLCDEENQDVKLKAKERKIELRCRKQWRECSVSRIVSEGIVMMKIMMVVVILSGFHLLFWCVCRDPQKEFYLDDPPNASPLGNSQNSRKIRKRVLPRWLTMWNLPWRLRNLGEIRKIVLPWRLKKRVRCGSSTPIDVVLDWMVLDEW